jgi:NADH-quinone oxidoreductase subunit C
MILKAIQADLAVLAGAQSPAVPQPAPVAEGQTPVAPRPPVLEANHAQVGYDLDVTLTPASIVAGARALDCHGFALEAITGVDWLSEGQLEVVYDFVYWLESCRVVLRVRVDRITPELPTISSIFTGADWHERETHDFFGIRFSGLDNLVPFLLPEDATFHPLRKDYNP